MNPDLTPEDRAALDRAELASAEMTLAEQRAALPKVCLHPLWWMPPILFEPTRMHPLRRAYRDENRPFRRAFGRGERYRKILLAVGAYNAKNKDNS